MNLDMIFRKEEKDYKCHNNYLANYYKQVAKFVKTMFPNTGPMELKYALKQVLDKFSGEEPYVTYYHKFNGVDRNEMTIKLSDYIKQSTDGNYIIVPSFTMYLSPDVKESSHGIFIVENIAERSRVKKLAFRLESEGDMAGYRFNNMLQKTLKTYNNGLSGSYESKYTILHNPSGHHTLTSITRTVASIGNLITESMVSGNRHYETPDTVLNHFTALITYAEFDSYEKTIEKFGLKYPTVDEVMDMVYYNTSHLWESTYDMDVIREFVEKMTKLERAIVLYTTDLYHIRKINPKFVADMLNKLSFKRYRYTGGKDPMKYIFDAPEWVYNLVMHICSQEVKGVGPIYELKNKKLINLLAGTTQAVIIAFRYFEDFFKTFFVTTISPINVAKTRDMLRRSIVVSDTDSTCGTYQEWVEWKYGEVIFGSKAIGFTAAVMTITTRAIDHYIRVFAANMNITRTSHRDMLKMKNEFYWDVMGLTNVGKHYFANVVIQEGNVKTKYTLEEKGVNLIASDIPDRFRKRKDEFEEFILTEVGKGNKLDIKEVIGFVADTERMVMKLIDEGSTEIFSVEKIGQLSIYKRKDEPHLTPYFHHMTWEAVYQPKYGEVSEPDYMAIKVPLTIHNKTTYQEFIDSLPEDFRERFLNHMGKYNKGFYTLARIPIEAVDGHGLPKEILPFIDRHSIVTTMCAPLYIILEVLGIVRKNGTLFMDLGY